MSETPQGTAQPLIERHGGMVENFSVALTLERDRARLRLCGELDADTTDKFSALFEQACAAEPSLLLVDLTELSFCDSSGVRVLVFSAAQCVRNGIELRIVGAQPNVRRVFEITDTADLLHIPNEGHDH